jgi:hypothetical protein
MNEFELLKISSIKTNDYKVACILGSLNERLNILENNIQEINKKIDSILIEDIDKQMQRL